ncbi:MAG: 3-hydroxyacyl-CoA dehydrogenase family protein [Deltaproteobacteria bacterium]|nr:3-hydroxyacyl-CoA dehydrogenase family protein [Deltaproteobacteria bacterium]
MKLEDIKCIGILGAGVMGGGIAQSAILAGYKVMVRDLKDEICEKARDTIVNGRFGIKGAVDRGKTTPEEMDRALSLLNFTTKLEDLKDCDLVIEAIGGGPDGAIENKDMKLQVFKELDAILKKGAVIASNTSRYTIADLAAVTSRKDRFVGMHLFSPANIMKLVEVIYTREVTEDLIVLIEELSKSWGKTPVRVKDVPGDTGFIGNRVMGAARKEAMKIVEEGIATAEDVNTAMELGFRWPAGPLPAKRPGARSGWQ